MTQTTARHGGPTMHDVARRAGVSTMTVSNVVNGRSDKVGPLTRARVLDAIDELGYRVNVNARSLRRGRTATVALAVPDIAAEYYGQVAHRLARRFGQQGLRLVLEHTRGELQAELDSLAAWHLDAYDGLVLAVAAGDVSDLDRAARPDSPVVLIGERALTSRFDHVMMDNVEGARLATAHLLAGGARRVVVLGGVDAPEESMAALRVQGYRRAHEDAGLEVDPDLVVDSAYTPEGGRASLARLLDRRPDVDAVFAVTDTVALGAIRAAADAGRRVPADLQVVGFDNLPSGQICVPRLTTVEPGNDEMADAVCRLLVARMQRGAEAGPPQQVMPAAQLVVRESSRAAAAGS